MNSGLTPSFQPHSSNGAGFDSQLEGLTIGLSYALPQRLVTNQPRVPVGEGREANYQRVAAGCAISWTPTSEEAGIRQHKCQLRSTKGPIQSVDRCGSTKQKAPATQSVPSTLVVAMTAKHAKGPLNNLNR